GVFSDAPIRSNSTALVETTATYTVATDLTDRDGNTPDDDSPLEASAGIATPGTPLTITNVVGTLKVRLSGPAGGSVELFDDDPTDGVIDAVVLTGTTRSHSLTITGDGDFSIARLLAADDATVRNFMFDGDIVGDDTDAPDIWIDGEVSRFQIRDLGTNVTGQIGGDVADLRMRDQGAGRLVIGGKVRTATIASASESPLLGLLTTFGNQVFNAFAFEDLGSSLWAHEGLGVLNNYTFDPLTDAVTFNSTLQVQDTFSDVDGDPTTDPVEVFGLDFLGGDLYGIIKAYAPQPVQRSAESLAVTTLNSLSNLAVDSANNVYAINSSGASNELVM
ncbi:MAG: hypothetical protein MI802_27510, partial [Desulfobacterales bacterium]|nr:hypothetical protein [Desulfobacterales bacterium]